MAGTSKSKTDVLVVGAGPVGLTMACELFRRGVECRVIESSEAPSETSKALGIQSRTLEVFKSMGIVERFLARGVRVIGANVYENDRLLLQTDTRHLDAPYPYILSLAQSDTEKLLTGLLGELGGQVEWSRELAGFGQERDRVIAFVNKDSGNAVEEIEAGWLIGCDGAHSRVRHTLGLPFEGSARPEEFLLGDVQLDWDRSRDRAHAWLHQDGVFLSIPLPGERRWRLISDIALDKGEEAPRASVEVFQELMEERTRDTDTNISNATWMSNFRISRRIVGEYRRDRVFLTGDAAHIHSPVGGQGMNTGIQDAYNLAWKLALVVKDKAPVRLLDTYEEERLPIARSVLRGTSLSTNIVVSRSPALRVIRNRVLTRVAGVSFLQERLLRRVSQLDVNYRESSLSRAHESPRSLLSGYEREKPGFKDWLTFRTAPRAGDRAPQGRCVRYPSRKKTDLFTEFAGTSFVLLLFGGPAPDGYERLSAIARRAKALLRDEIETYLVVDYEPEDVGWSGRILVDTERELCEVYGAGSECLYLIRPDGYIGFRSQPVREASLLDYLGKLFLLDDVSHKSIQEKSTVYENR